MTIRDDMLAALVKLPAEDFLATHMFDRVPHVFDGKRDIFIYWKKALSHAIDVDPACIAIVGSSALGVSLNPAKGFKNFDDKSDVDVGIISHYHFTVAWRYLRTQGHRRMAVDQKTRAAWNEHVTRLIYWGTIATDRLLGILPFGKQWLDALALMGQTEPTVGRDINLRIYSDYEALRAYQTMSVQHARQESLMKGESYAEVS